jgi:hypothetical protein
MNQRTTSYVAGPIAVTLILLAGCGGGGSGSQADIESSNLADAPENEQIDRDDPPNSEEPPIIEEPTNPSNPPSPAQPPSPVEPPLPEEPSEPIEEPLQRTISLSIGQGGQVVSSSGAYDCASSCVLRTNAEYDETFTAIADDGYRFTGWAGPCGEVMEPCTIGPTQPNLVELTALFGVKRGDGYIEQDIDGFKVIVNENFFDSNNQLAQAVLGMLKEKFRDAIEVAPSKHHHFLSTVNFWVEEHDPEFRGMTYHPGIDWLLQHGRHPEKVESVEIYNATDFLQWEEDQPWFVLHELAHAFHHQIHTFEHPTVIDAYNNALNQGLYASVRHADGRIGRAYALTNRMEYFAELTEAYFGRNDAYPFVRSELKEYDILGYQAVETLWGVAN